MKNIAEALIYSIEYLGNQRNDQEFTEDDDLKIVEQAAALIQEASEEEKAILIRASQKLGLENWASQIGI